jgi:hypothetical protein
MKTKIGDTQPYRGIEFAVFETKPGEWKWSYHPKIEKGAAERGQIKGTREAAIIACKAAIDKWLGLEGSN